MSEKKQRKINFYISNEQAERVDRIVPHGLRGPVLMKLLERVLDAAEEHGQIVFGVVLDNDFEISIRRALQNSDNSRDNENGTE